MTVVLPYPDKPANGQTPDATPILANLIALLNAINAFDGAGINAKSVQAAALADSINPITRDAGWQTKAGFVESGGFTSVFAGLTWTMPNGVAWFNGNRFNFAGAGYSVAINQDTYYTVNQSGTVDAPVGVANGAAAPAIPSNSQRLAKVVSGPAAITQIQDQRNLSPLDGANLVTGIANTGTAGGSMSFMNLGGLKLLWGNTNTGLAGGGAAYTVVFPAGYFATIQLLNIGTGIISGASSDMRTSLQAYTASGFTFFINGTAQAQAHFLVIGF